MAEYDVRLEFTFDAEDRATADETVGGIMGHIVDRTDCGSVGGRMVEGEEDTTEHRVTADPHREKLEEAVALLRRVVRETPDAWGQGSVAMWLAEYDRA